MSKLPRSKREWLVRHWTALRAAFRRRALYTPCRQGTRLRARQEAKEQRQVDRLDALDAARKARKGRLNAAWDPSPVRARARRPIPNPGGKPRKVAA